VNTEIQTYNAPVRLLVYGATGRMGQTVLRLAAEDKAINVVAAVTHTPPEHSGYIATSELDSVPPFDVAIDFSLPVGFDAIVALCVRHKAGLVSGTTGLSAQQQTALAAAGSHIPLVWASNFSLGVAVLTELVEQTAANLPGWDCDIIEAHHRHKLDAPSGTALTLDTAAQRGGAAPHHASVRAGDIVGEHCVQFTGLGERLELVHRASNRDIFARGALYVAKQLRDRAAGRYQIKDLLGATQGG